MATNEELTVTIKTVADTSGARQAQQSLQEVARSRKIAEADRAADLTQAQIRQAGGFEAFLAQQRARVPAGAGQAASPAGQIAQSAFSVRQLGLAFFGASTAASFLHQAIGQIAQSMGDAIQATREYQRAVPYASTETTNLDTAFNAAKRSGDSLEITLGKLAAPAVTSGLKAQASALDGINDALKNAAGWLQEHNQAPLARGIPALSNEAPFGPAAPEIAAAAAERRKAEEDFPRQQARLRALNDLTFTAGQASAAADQARLDRWAQIDAAATALNDAQNRQLGLQQQSVNLTAQEAELRLSMVPAQERLAALQRDVAEQQIRARQAALPATEGLEDVQSRIERDRLLLTMRRQLAPDQVRAARLDIRDLSRNVLPGARLAAFDADRAVTLAGRGVERVGLEQQLFQIGQERSLAQVTAAQEANGYLRQIAEQRTQAIQLTINLSGESFTQEVMNQVVTVFHSARMAAENAASQQLAGA